MKKLLRIVTAFICLSPFLAFTMEKPDLELDDNNFEQIIDTFYETNKAQTLSVETANAFLTQNKQEPTIQNLQSDFNTQSEKAIQKHGRKPQTYFETALNGQLQCPHCPKTAKERYLLTTHIYKNHGKGSEVITCPHCPKIVYRKNLSNHKKSHLNS